MPPVKNLILVHGDCSSLPEKILQMKKYFFPGGDLLNNWVELPPPLSKKKKEIDQKWFDKFDAELSSLSWDDSKKIVYLKEILDNEKFLVFISEIVKKIPSSNHLVICDPSNVLVGGKAKKDNYNWTVFFEYCKKNAYMVNLGISFKTLPKEEQLNFIVDFFKKKEKTISLENAELLLEIVGPSKVFLETEIEKICLIVDEATISKKDVLNIAFPISQDYPVWMFYTAINTGSFGKIMDAVEKLVENDFNYDSILILSLKQLRWHVICSSQLLHNKEINLKDFEKQLSKDKIKEKILKNKCMDPRINNQLVSIVEKKEIKSENIPSFYNLRDIRTFVENLLPKFCDNPKSQLSVMRKAIERYLIIYDGLYELRTCNKDMQNIVFTNALRKISVVN